MRALGVTTKIYLILALSGATALGATAFLLYRVADVSNRFGAILDGQAMYAKSLVTLEVGFKTQIQEWKNVLLRGQDAKDLQKFREAFLAEEAKVVREARRLRDVAPNAELRAKLDRFIEEHNRLGEAYHRALEAYTQAGGKNVFEVDRGLRGIDRPAAVLIEEIVVQVSQEADAAIKLENAALAGERWQVAFAVLLAVALAIGGAAYLSRSIAHSLRATVAILGRLADGDFRQRLEVTLRDELGQMAAAVNRTADRLAEVLGTIRQSSQGLAGSSEGLSAVSQQLSSNSEETSSQATMVSAASGQVSRNMQTVATAVEELSSSIKEIARSAGDAARVATGAVETASAADATVAKLGASSVEIGAVVKVITSIAQQTNLLALNATIEAARAGEAGKGFAVVANEVKELAKETARATEDIGRKIEAIRADADGAVGALRQIGGVIGQIHDLQNTIASAVEQQTATTQEIARNVSEAAQGSGEIERNVAAVAEAARSTSEGAAHTQDSAIELAQMAGELQQLLARFRCDAADTDRDTTDTPREHAAEQRPSSSNGKARPVGLNGHKRLASLPTGS